MRTPVTRHLSQPWWALLLSLALPVGCATGPAPTAVPAAASSAPVTVRLIAFNDLHGHLESAGLTLPWPDPVDRTKVRRLSAGGAAHLAGLVESLRAGAQHHVTISSGDLIGATPLISGLFLHESTIDVANRMGVDFGIPGNHEFDAGQDELLRMQQGGCAETPAPPPPKLSCALGRFEGAKFPLVAANVLKTDGSTLFAASVVRQFGGIRMGFIGAVTRATPGIVAPSGVSGLRFADEAAAVNAEAARLKAQGVEALVAVIHEGGDTGAPGVPTAWNDTDCPHPRGEIFEIVRRLTPDIDLVFSAHTHQGYRCVVDGRPVLQATSFGRGVSVADLVLDPITRDVDRARTTHRNLPVLNDHTDPMLRQAVIAAEPAPWAQALRDAQPAPAVTQRVAEYARVAQPRAQQASGRIGGSFGRSARTDASAGRLVADAQWQATRAPQSGGADLALMNPGGVRTDLRCAVTPPCTVTYADLYAMQPYGNNLVVLTLSGAELRQLLEDQQQPGRGSPLFLIPSSSMTYAWHASAPHGRRVQDLRIAGGPVQPSRDYRITVNSFLAEGGDGVAMLTRGRQRVGGMLDLDALVQHLLATSPSPDPVPRIHWVD